MYDKRYHIKHNASEGKHIPDKYESKILRKIMSQTGMTEEQVREIPKYRKLLSQNQKRYIDKNGINNIAYKILTQIMKSVTKELKLAKEHPDVIKEFRKRVEERKGGYGRGNWELRFYPLNNFFKK